MNRQPAPDRARQLTETKLVSRRDYLRMLVVASGGLLLGTTGLAGGLFRRHGSGEAAAAKIAGQIPPGDVVNFSYPGQDDPAIAYRLEDGELAGFSTVCPHLACAVLWRKDHGLLECPCHDGFFDQRTGEVLAGPPARPLPKITLEERSDGIYATGTDH
ncbi:MAG: Rieske (2Fe-2S) protein [Actinomycetota bacterium]